MNLKEFPQLLASWIRQLKPHHTEKIMDKIPGHPLYTTNKLFIAVLVSFFVIIISLSAYIGYLKHNSIREQVQILDNFTKISDGFRLTPEMSDAEQFYKFQRFMMRVMNTFGMQYNKNYPQAIPPEQQAKYIKLLWDGAVMMKMDPYRVPVIHQIESCFNPKAYNTNSGLGEKGIGQQCWSAALHARMLLEFLPPQLKQYFYFDVKTTDDLFDWETSTKVTFVLLYFLDREFNGREEWADSVYHWGGFLRRYWDKGLGTIPNKFTFSSKKRGSIEYDVIAYYMTTQKLSTAYNAGDLEYGRTIYNTYQEKESFLMKEEIQLRTARGIVRRLKAELEQERIAKEEAIQRKDVLEKVINDASDDIDRIYGNASRMRTGEQMRVELKLHKDVMVKVLKRLKLDELEQNIAKLQRLIFILFIFLTVLLSIIIYVTKKYKKMRGSK